MTKKDKSRLVVLDKEMGCCKVESLISVDERGQMVIPKEIRDKANIKGGDKLALITWEKNKKISCVTLIKADELTGFVNEFLGPVMNIMLKNKD